MRHLIALCFVAAATAACNDTNFRIDPLLAHGEVTVAAPVPGNEALPTALDVTASSFVIRGGRFPERSSDAEQWDFAVRIRDGELTLVPAAMFGIDSRAALTRALPSQTFEELRQAPPPASFRSDSAVVMRVGQVYAARSRNVGGAFGTCQQYAKLQPLDVDVNSGLLRLRITTNERCGDLRLVPED